MLTESEWRLLTRLYAAGRRGIPYSGGNYGSTDAWSALQTLRRRDPPLAREVTRLDPRNSTTHYLIMITDAGRRFYERNQRRYRIFYPA